MEDPTDQPVQQAEPDCGHPLVRLDVGGWISGPCLDPAALKPLPDGHAEPGWAWPADNSQRSAR
jgi:hypothetical protein